MPSKYLLTPPESLHSLTTDSRKSIYPDFDPWRHTPIEDKIFLNFVSKGYYNSARVNFESISSRSSLQESLPAVSGLLADQLSQVVCIREDQVNKISAKSQDLKTAHAASTDLCGPGFLLPKRVTLTDHKRELWLQEISSPHSSLAETVKTIPHGLKRRQLLEQCCLKQIPVPRAIWLIKCCYTLEWKTLVNKQSFQERDEASTKLLKEWSDTMAHILEKLVFEMTQFYNEPVKLKNWRQRIAYYLKLLGNCYSLGLIEKDVFHHWLVDFVGKIENFECLPMTLHILTVFWTGIFPKSQEHNSPQQLFQINKMTEALIYKYYMVSTSKSMINDEQYLINDVKKNNKLSMIISSRLKDLIVKIFEEQPMEAFVFPSSNWEIYKNCLYKILQVDGPRDGSKRTTETSKKLELIVYRNDSLKFNTILHEADEDRSVSNNEQFNDLESIFIPKKILKLRHIDYNLTKLLDGNSAGDDWMNFADQKLTRVDQLIQMILWAVHPSRIHHYEASQLVAKLFLLKINIKSGLMEYSLEDKVWALIFVFAKIKTEDLKLVVNLPRLHQLLNVFIGYGLLKVPTYIRKLISSGVLYLPESGDKFFHCDLLINLKISPVMKSQYNMVLRNVIDANPQYYEDFNYDRLMESLEQAKACLSEGKFDFVIRVPYCIKLMASEWYLNHICSTVNGVLTPVTKKDVIEKLKVFCINLEVYHQFYKWVEFIVYHKLLEDLEALECLVDILIYYDKLFSLLINDHILLMKTILHLYSDKLLTDSPESQSLILLSEFWHFFMSKFPLALEIDIDLQTKLLEANEFEKAKIEKVLKQKPGTDEFITNYERHTAHTLQNDNDDAFNFPSIFQPNLKILLTSVVEDEIRCARKMMRVLMIMNLSEYNKFMSIFLKRKTASDEDLARLVSLKILSLTLIQKVLGEYSLVTLLNTVFYEHGMAFELQKRSFTRHNISTVMNAFCDTSPNDYKELLSVLVEYCSFRSAQEHALKIFDSMETRGDNSLHSFAEELLTFGVGESNFAGLQNPLTNKKSAHVINDDGDMTDDEVDVIDLYSRLDFTNLWIFQILTCHYLRQSQGSVESRQSQARFVLDSIRMTNFDLTASKLFDKVTNADVLQQTLQTLEVDFLRGGAEQDSEQNSEQNSQYHTIIETIINISRRLNKVLAGNIPISDESFNLLQTCCREFALKDSNDLSSFEFRLDVFLKILIVHQKFIIREGLQNSRLLLENNGEFLRMLCLLFHKIGFSLKLKLLLYDVLASLKSFVVYSSTGKTSQLSFKGQLKVPQELLDLPPFKITSFMPDSALSSAESSVALGIENMASNKMIEKPTFFIYNKKMERFETKLIVRPFHVLNNFREEGSDFNNTPLNMCLFNACFDRRNPT
ncbi:LANO_0A01156g1_1 [Lachancea nothofagi CBS 11611]|uniref:Mediator of RNA polymerase II transcription subunit 12 n=1 Tax=Lachancea nothofagi CBS 11611 TaxID=1266666 RepID=A0A1G4IM76_9SACH|nr:LANO_0A01156g1_1 [Lachancea nothofagi CBS 11611]